MSENAPDDGLDASLTPAQRTLLRVVRRLLAPILRLLVSQGLKIQQFEEVAKRAYIDAALAHGTANNASQLSVATGIHRKDVVRLLASGDSKLQSFSTLASQVFLRWASDPMWRDEQGVPTNLPLRSDNPEDKTFETLARSVTTDVHPRSVLDELIRLQMVVITGDGTAHLAQDAFVPKPELDRMLNFLAESGHDHLSASVNNVLGLRDPMLEQSVLADTLSQASVEQIHQMAREQWAQAMQQVVLKATELEQHDVLNNTANWRIRVGMYAYTEPLPVAEVAESTEPAAPRKRGRPPKPKP